MKRVCIIGCGSIGSLYAAHLARVAEVWAFVRRPEHARALNENGLHVTGGHEFHTHLRATHNPAELPKFDLGIVSCKGTQTAEALGPVAHLFDNGAILSSQNGLGAEEIIADLAKTYVIRGTTFMSGTRHDDTHVQYELDTATWMGPWARTATPYASVQRLAALLVSSGLEAEPMPDLLPAQWSKLIFNSAINTVAAMTGLPHVALFAQEEEFGDLGRLVHGLIDEGVAVAGAAGVLLHDDPWEMNVLAVARGETAHSDYAHRPSMLEEVLAERATEVEFITGALVREAGRLGVAVPLSTAMYRLVRATEASWGLADGAEAAAVVA